MMLMLPAFFCGYIDTLFNDTSFGITIVSFGSFAVLLEVSLAEDEWECTCQYEVTHLL